MWDSVPGSRIKSKLEPLCPERWAVKYVSMSSVLANYYGLVKFFPTLSDNDASCDTERWMVQRDLFVQLLIEDTTSAESVSDVVDYLQEQPHLIDLQKFGTYVKVAIVFWAPKVENL